MMETILPTVGARIAHARTELQLSRSEMAQRIGVSVRDLSIAERGEAGAPLAVLAGLMLHFPGLDGNWLLAGRGALLLGTAGAGNVPAAQIDPVALDVVERLYQEELARRTGDGATRLVARKADYLALVYGAYIRRLIFFRNGDRTEEEARALAYRSCEEVTRQGAARQPGESGAADAGGSAQ